MLTEGRKDKITSLLTAAIIGARQARGLDYDSAGALIGISPEAYRALEEDPIRTPLNVLSKVMRGFGCYEKIYFATMGMEAPDPIEAAPTRRREQGIPSTVHLRPFFFDE